LTNTFLHLDRYAPNSVRRVMHILLFPSFLFDRGPVALDEVGTEGYGR
jgi:hypothetical protein